MHPTYHEYDQDEAIILDEAAPLGSSHQVMLEMLAGINKITHMLAKEYEQPEIDTPVMLSGGQETILSREGRRFLLIYSPVQIAACTLNMLGVKSQVTLGVGWTIINGPDRTIITPPGSTSQQVIIRATNWTQGSAI